MFDCLALKSQLALTVTYIVQSTLFAPYGNEDPQTAFKLKVRTLTALKFKCGGELKQIVTDAL